MIRFLILAALQLNVISAYAQDAKVQVAGMRSVLFENEESGVRAFGAYKGLTMAILVKTPESAINFGGVLQTVLTDSNENLVGTETEMKAWFPKDNLFLSEVELKPPSNSAKYIKEASGQIRYETVEKTETIDLGIERFASGERGKRLLSSIVIIAPDFSEPNRLVLTLNLNTQNVKAVKKINFFDDKGQPIDVADEGYDMRNYDLTVKYLIPEYIKNNKGKIAADVITQTKPHTLPFVIRDIDFLGRLIDPNKK